MPPRLSRKLIKHGAQTREFFSFSSPYERSVDMDEDGLGAVTSTSTTSRTNSKTAPTCTCTCSCKTTAAAAAAAAAMIPSSSIQEDDEDEGDDDNHDDDDTSSVKEDNCISDPPTAAQEVTISSPFLTSWELDDFLQHLSYREAGAFSASPNPNLTHSMGESSSFDHVGFSTSKDRGTEFERAEVESYAEEFGYKDEASSDEYESALEGEEDNTTPEEVGEMIVDFFECAEVEAKAYAEEDGHDDRAGCRRDEDALEGEKDSKIPQEVEKTSGDDVEKMEAWIRLRSFLDVGTERAAEAQENEGLDDGGRANCGQQEGALEGEDTKICKEVEEMSDKQSLHREGTDLMRRLVNNQAKKEAEAKKNGEEGKDKTLLEWVLSMMGHCRIRQQVAYQQGFMEGRHGRFAGMGIAGGYPTPRALELMRLYGARGPPRVPQSLSIGHGTSTSPSRSFDPITVTRAQGPPSGPARTESGNQILQQVQSLSQARRPQITIPSSRTVTAKAKWEHLRQCRDQARSFLQNGAAISDTVFSKLTSDSILQSPFLPLGDYEDARTTTLAWSLNQTQSKMLIQQAAGTLSLTTPGREAREDPIVRRRRALRREYPSLKEMVAKVWGQRDDREEDVPILSRNPEWEDGRAERAEAAADKIKTEWPALSMWLLGELHGEYPGECLVGASSS